MSGGALVAPPAEPRGAARMARIFAALISADIVTRALAAVATIIVVRALAPEAFGEVAFALAAAAALGVLADLGLPLLLVRDVSADSEEAPRLLGAALDCVAILGGAVFGAGALLTLSGWTLGPASSGAMALGLAVMAANALVRPFEATVTGYGRAHLVTLANCARGSALVGLSAAVAMVVPTPVAFLAGAAAAELVGLVTLAMLCRLRCCSPDLRVPVGELLALARRALPFALLAGFSLLYLRIDLIMLGLLGSDTAVGNYGVAARVLDTAVAVPAFFGGAFLATVAQAGVERARVGDQTERALRYLLLGCVPLAFALALVADPLLDLIAGESYGDAPGILVRLSPVLVLTAAYAVLGYLQVALDRIRLLAMISLSGIAIKIAVNAWAIPRYGANGAALAAVAGETLVVVAQWYSARRDFDAASLFGWCGRLALSALPLVAAGLLALAGMPWLTALALGLPAFAAATLISGCISVAELRRAFDSAVARAA
jgi:O-antigen/teichoic acid export membrane protein